MRIAREVIHILPHLSPHFTVVIHIIACSGPDFHTPDPRIKQQAIRAGRDRPQPGDIRIHCQQTTEMDDAKEPAFSMWLALALRALEQGCGIGRSYSSPISMMRSGVIVTLTRTWPGRRKG
jgi:hypothetical protein